MISGLALKITAPLAGLAVAGGLYLAGHWRGVEAGRSAERAEADAAALETLIASQNEFMDDLRANQADGRALIDDMARWAGQMGVHSDELSDLYAAGATRCVTDPDVYRVRVRAHRDAAAAIARARSGGSAGDAGDTARPDRP